MSVWSLLGQCLLTPTSTCFLKFKSINSQQRNIKENPYQSFVQNVGSNGPNIQFPFHVGQQMTHLTVIVVDVWTTGKPSQLN